MSIRFSVSKNVDTYIVHNITFPQTKLRYSEGLRENLSHFLKMNVFNQLYVSKVRREGWITLVFPKTSKTLSCNWMINVLAATIDSYMSIFAHIIIQNKTEHLSFIWCQIWYPCNSIKSINGKTFCISIKVPGNLFNTGDIISVLCTSRSEL